MYTRIARSARPSDPIASQMVWPVATISADATVADAASALAEDEVGALLVIEHDRLVGVISERDVVRTVATQARLDRTRVGDVMSLEPVTVASGSSLGEAARVMQEAAVRHLPVVDGEDIAGILSIRDLLEVYVESHRRA